MDILDKYIKILDFLVEFLGKDTEVVLQDFRNGFDHSVVYIKNNLSGRKKGAPATDFVMDVFKSKIYLHKDYIVNYRTKSLNGMQLYSSSFFIKENNKLIGMICLNTDKSKILKLKNLFEASLKIIDEETTIEYIDDDEELVKETFFSNSENLIDAVILEETQGKDISKYPLTKDEKVAIVRSLYQKEFFNLKNSIEKLANVFSMSEVSIYKYIQQVKSEQ
ncbi:transcriptional regulator [Helcococcus kunzii]|uniref:helix-turn-helix transcriptional regulator n=1 Tax=Helcococcus kunzii TaxID=40091 RepID=UPI00389E4A42